MRWIRRFEELSHRDVALVGGKNASLGEMIRHLVPLGVRVPDGFAVTAAAYREFLAQSGLESRIREALAGLGPESVDELQRVTREIREEILGARLMPSLCDEIGAAYLRLVGEAGDPARRYVAVRSSATAEDLPEASFAGQQESFLYVSGVPDLLEAVKRCFASLFTARAVSYRRDVGFSDLDVALSVGVQRMVRSDLGSAGVAFTLDTDSGFPDVVLINACFGVGESVVKGRVVPDEIFVHKPTLRAGFPAILWKKVGSKEEKVDLDPAEERPRTVPTPPEERARLSLADPHILELARWSVAIEDHYSALRGAPTPMDIEWALDGATGQLFVVQARPETVHSRRAAPTLRRYRLTGSGELLGEGLAIGAAVGSGRAHAILDPRQGGAFVRSEVLVTRATDPDWEPIMKRAGAIVTEQGGRTSHAAIVARELGIPAVVGLPQALARVPGGETVTVSCAEGAIGRVYSGEVPFEVTELDAASLPATRTRLMVNLANPEQAFSTARLPADGVGLARMEFIFAGWVGVHPLALLRPEAVDPEERAEVARRVAGYPDGRAFFIDRMSQGIAVLAGAFYPRPVILRFSDFKTNEYAHLLGGRRFEPEEENPMLGWRGASRYYDPEFRDGFLLEVAAVKRVRHELGLTNLKVMVPFCRTPEEGARVLAVMAEGGLVRGEDGLEVYAMAEIPSNVFVAERFAGIFDGFSIGSNDLTQLILGLDRDSRKVAPLFDERDEAVERACAMLIDAAHRAGVTVGICGQAPSDHPEFAAFLVGLGIDSMSVSPDALFTTRLAIAEAEKRRRAA